MFFILVITRVVSKIKCSYESNTETADLTLLTHHHAARILLSYHKCQDRLELLDLAFLHGYRVTPKAM